MATASAHARLHKTNLYRFVLLVAGCLELEPYDTKTYLTDLVLFGFWFDGVSSTMV